FSPGQPTSTYILPLPHPRTVSLPRSRKLLCSGREETSRLKEAQVRHRFVVTTLVSPTPGETKKWGSLSLCQLRKRWASPPKDVSTGSPRSQGNDYAEWRSRSERLSRVGNRRPRLSSPEGAADLGAGAW